MSGEGGTCWMGGGSEEAGRRARPAGAGCCHVAVEEGEESRGRT